MKTLFLLLFFSTPFFAWSMEQDEIPIVYREPAGLQRIEDDLLDGRSRARVDLIIDNDELKAVSAFGDWYPGEFLALESQTPGIGIIAFVEVKKVTPTSDGLFDVQCELQRQSRVNFVQIGDQLMHLDLSTYNDKYVGTTDLIIKQGRGPVSSKYKPLFTQGFTVGETAQALWKNEYLVTWFGQIHYGVNDWLTVNSVLPADVLGAPNASMKARLYEGKGNVFSAGLVFAKIPDGENESTLNLNLYWDSISSETVVSHTFLSIALYSFDSAENSTAIKSLGTSSLQTGYEFILPDWDRVLVGPSYNFETKAVGGYLAYLRIWDRFHGGVSINSTNLTTFSLDPNDGYYFLFDAYWRY